MNIDTREKRLRSALRKSNELRKKQKLKIDILCNDFLSHNRQFIEQLKGYVFAAEFFKSLIGISDFNKLLYSASRPICSLKNGLGLVFVFENENNYELHSFNNTLAPESKNEGLEVFLNPAVVHEICSSNRICRMTEMLELGLECNPLLSKKIDAAALPFKIGGSPKGFILLQINGEDNLTDELIDTVNLITSGLSKAIAGCDKFNVHCP